MEFIDELRLAVYESGLDDDVKTEIADTIIYMSENATPEEFAEYCGDVTRLVVESADNAVRTAKLAGKVAAAGIVGGMAGIAITKFTKKMISATKRNVQILKALDQYEQDLTKNLYDLTAQYKTCEDPQVKKQIEALIATNSTWINAVQKAKKDISHIKM